MSTKRVAVLQSNYLPWKGYFDIINDVDLFVFYDDLQFTKNDWRNRNRIKAAQGVEWISIPVGQDVNRLICEVELKDANWQAKHWRTLQQSYSRCPHFGRYKDYFEHVYLGQRWTHLSALNQSLIRHISREFLGSRTEFADSRSWTVAGQKLDRLLDLVVQSGATHYLSGPAARDYIEPERFAEAGIALEWKSYEGYPEYRQRFPPFEHGVSILDLLFNAGPDAAECIWGWRRGAGAAPAATLRTAAPAQPKLLHVLGGGPWRVPTVEKAKALGYRVLVTDMFAERPAYALADHHEVVDITDRDGTLAVARRHGIAGILCDTTDVGVPTAAYVAERLGLAGIGLAVAEACTNKGRMRLCTQTAGLSGTCFGVIEQEHELAAAAAAVGLPLLVKPVNNQSGRGVTLVRQAGDLAAAWQAAQPHRRNGPVLLDAFVAGREYIVDGFGVDGSWVLLGIAEKTQYADNPTLSSRIRYLEGEAFDALHRVLEPAWRATAAALGLRSGLLHAEFIVDGAKAVPIDVAARGGGVMIYQRVLPHVSGVDVMAAAIRLALGEPVTIEALPRRRAACVEFLRLPAGELVAVDGLEAAAALPGVAAVHLNLLPGQTVGPALANKDDRPGFVVVLGDSGAEVIATAGRAKSLLKARMAGASAATAIA